MTHAQLHACARHAIALGLGGSVLTLGAALGAAAPLAIDDLSSWCTETATEGAQPVTWGW
jgi:hypothetical protein